MKNLVQIEVAECVPAEMMNPVTKRMEPKVTKAGEPVFNLFYIRKEKRQIAGKEIEEVRVEKIGSLLNLKPGSYILEVELFAIDGKIYPRAIATLKI